MLARRRGSRASASDRVRTRSSDNLPPHFVSAAWVTVTALLVTLSAAAEPASKGDHAAASDQFERGVAHFNAGEMDAAAREFEAAFATKAHPAVLFNLGRTYVALGRSVDAVRVLEQYLASQEIIPKQRRDAVEALVRAQRQRIGHLVVASSQAGVLISIDGIDVGKTPLPAPVPLTLGPHGVVARAEGSAVQAYSVTIEPLAKFELDVRLDNGKAEPDGAAASPPAAAAPSPPPVSKTVTAASPPDVSSAATTSQAPVLSPAGLVLIGGGVAAAGFGTYFGIRAADNWSTRNQHCEGGCDADAVEAGRDAEQFASMANAAFALSIVSVGIGAFLVVKSVTSSSVPTAAKRRPLLALSKTGKGWFVQVAGNL